MVNNMNHIQVLDQETINQIAAGEVIERPASVVKELLENAIDAKASAVTVEIKDGGTSFIRITDNGCGIEKSDIPLAFLRHSTSKIKSAIDLLTVSSLGFRGEALSSIAAVAMVELITKTDSSLSGTRYCIEGGVKKSIEDIGVPNGTTFIIRNLFFNTPARRKFLKTASTEAGYIADIVERIALSHPEVSVRFICNNSNKLHTSGNGSLKDVIYTIFHRDIAMNLIEINQKCPFMTLTGYIGKPVISRGNRNYENYFINGRYIKSSFIARAIEDSYKSFMMQHKYPFTCINVEINQELLDVNVHPTKMELRFRNHEEIYPFVYKTLDDALHKKEMIPEATFDGKDIYVAKSTSKPEQIEISNKQIEISNKKVEIPNKQIETPNEQKEPINKKIEIPNKKIETQKVKAPEPFEVNRIKENISKENISKEVFVKEETKPYQMEMFDDKLLSAKARIQHRVVGQVFDTYWIVEYGDKMYLIDQHAAHEKVLYERLFKRYKEKEKLSQEIIPPVVISLTMREEQCVLRNKSMFEDIGYEIESLGGSEYAIRSVPYDLLSISKEELLIEMIDNLMEEENSKITNEVLLDRMATMSCKAAVKGNNKLSVLEANKLIDELLSLDNPYNCPHGRPTIISMTKYELEKKFKRII